MTGSTNTLPIGTQLGPYRILALAEGSYKASDTRRDAVVTLRLLPRQTGEAGDLLGRLGSLQHPAIGAVHDIAQHEGHTLLVSEFLEGVTLAARLEQGPMDWKEVIEIAIPVAGALESAHTARVLHGGLQPGNVVLTTGGPRLREFGVAAWESAAASAPVVIASPGAPTVTVAGDSLETLRYRAPEQLEGLPADERTDIFAFGLLLHEMLTGRKTFDGKSRMLLVSAITTADPEPISRAQPAAPALLDHIVHVCLSKEPADRWQTAHDLQAELRWIAEGGDAAGLLAGAPKPRLKRRWWEVPLSLSHAPLLAAGLLVAAVALPAVLYFRGPAVDEFRFQVPASTGSGLTPTQTITRTGRDSALSPDGRSLALVTQSVTLEPVALFVLPLGSIAPRRLPATEDATQPFWSADSRFIGYVNGGKLRKIEASGGPPREICDAPDFSGGT